MSSKVKPAAVLAELVSPLTQFETVFVRGYWVIPISPTDLQSACGSALAHPTVSEVTWSHLHVTSAPAPLRSTTRTLCWSKTRLMTLWRRLEVAVKNFGGVIVECHFLGDSGSREEVRLYCSGRRALLWRGLLNTLHPNGTGGSESERWFKGCGLVWRTQDGTAVMVA